MPIYVYRNLVTDETFEIEQRMTDEPLTVHPETGEPVKRLIQPVGIVFKGAGFYVNDSRRSGGSQAGAASDGAAGSDKGGGDAGGAKSPASTEPAAAAKSGGGAKGSAGASAD